MSISLFNFSLLVMYNVFRLLKEGVYLDINKKNVAHRIKNIRQERGMTMEEFGKLFGTTKHSVSNWENAKNLPNVTRLKEIADYGDITIEELLYGDDNIETPVNIFMIDRFNDYYKKKQEIVKTELKLLGGSILGSLGIIKDSENIDRYNNHQNFFRNFKEYAIEYINKNYKDYSYDDFSKEYPDSTPLDFQKFKSDEWDKVKTIFDEIIDNYQSTFTESNSVWTNKRFTSQIDDDLTNIKIKAIEEGKIDYYVNEVVQPFFDQAAKDFKEYISDYIDTED